MSNRKVCPWWLGYLLLIPFRKLKHNPEKMLQPFIKNGMQVIDYGSAMGFFSLPMAKMVGSNGKVYCFDIQKKMLENLLNRAKKAQLDGIIEPRLVTEAEAFAKLDGTIDFALLFYVAHEVSDQIELFRKLALMLKPGALLLFEEPAGHVPVKDFENCITIAEKAGFIKHEMSTTGKKLSIVLKKA